MRTWVWFWFVACVLSFAVHVVAEISKCSKVVGTGKVCMLFLSDFLCLNLRFCVAK